jgi:pimeloyl-ACP methyl ester carboxylesterase
MGGKTVMKFALEHAERVSKLVVVDIAPAGYSMQNAEVFSALQAVDVAHASSRSEVEDALRSKLSGDESTIQFLMKGLIRDNEGIHFEWKFNLHSLVNNLAEISGNIDAAKPYYGPALFIKGQYSKYINAENYPVIEHLFPNNSLSEIKRAGHWVHADNPQDFINEVLTFLL